MSKNLRLRQTQIRKRTGQSSIYINLSEQKNKSSTSTKISSRHLNDTINKKSSTKTFNTEPKLNISLDSYINLDMSLLQERAYSESYLPLTMKIAEQSKKLLTSKLNQFPKEWPFQDKILAWIIPTFRKDIREFHKNNGPNMAVMFRKHQLEHLDKDLSKRLAELVKNLISVF